MTTARLVVDVPGIRIYHGRADTWDGGEHIDLVFTNPYGPLPESLKQTPMIVQKWCHRRAELERWCGTADLELIGTWNNAREAFWSVNIEYGWIHSLAALRLEEGQYRPEPGGWYPEEMVRRILDICTPIARPFTIWDGFMGRSTIGKICRERGIDYVGVEELEKHIALAVEYLGVES